MQQLEVAILAIESDLPSARLLAQDLRAEGVNADAFGLDAADDVFGAALCVVFFASPAALYVAEWRGIAAIGAADRLQDIIVALSGDVDREELARILPTRNVAAASAQAVMSTPPLFDGDAPSVAPPAAAPGASTGAIDHMLGGFDDTEEEAEAAEMDEPEAPRAAAPKKVAAPAPAREQLESRPRRARRSYGEDAAEESAGAIKSAKLFENAPRRMRLGERREVTVRISAQKGAEKGMSGAISEHAIMAAQVMTVTLDDPDFAFAIRPLTPATQWIDRSAVARLGLVGAAATAEWRWSVEPIKTGSHRLSIAAAARVTDANGMSADAGLPAQTVQVSVSVAPGRIVARSLRWAAVALGAGAIGHFGNEVIEAVRGALG
ncbi:MAG: hypothetical protein MRY74_17035 [Neomegalonema sp.]|nr:hypothetical protein [Neomegalonema sp.]